MMKLILSLTLIWTLSSTAEGLQCWQGTGDTKELRPCNATEWCATIATQGTENGTLYQETIRTCMSPPPNIEGKHSYSYNFGFAAESTHVCNTDGCNNQTIPYPGVNLQCFTCEDPFSAECKKKTVQCRGDEDRCFSETGFCEHLSDLQPLPGGKFIQPPKCCEGSFCNSAWSVKLNVMTLLFGLITLIIY